MKKVVSNEQRLANRRNAQKSTGPKTSVGRARSARNALKHGLLAKDVVINGPDLSETQADFDSLLADLMNEFKPRTLIEETLVERIATGYWRLRRAQRFEVGAIRNAVEVPDPQTVALDKLRKKLQDEEAELTLETRLADLLSKPSDRLTAEESHELRESLDDFAAANGLHKPVLENPARMHSIREYLSKVFAEDHAKVDALRAEFDAAEREDSLRRARRPFASALPDRDALLKLVRYENMLDRQIHRALAELRRLRAVPYDGTNQKKRTRKTKPFEIVA